MRYEDSMVKVADDIIREQQADSKARNKTQKWHDEYATLKFFRFICRNVGNLREGEIQRLIWKLKQSDKEAVEKCALYVRPAFRDSYRYDSYFCQFRDNFYLE